MPPSYIRVRAVVLAYGRGQTDTQTRVTTIHFASSTTQAKCNKLYCFYLIGKALFLKSLQAGPGPPEKNLWDNWRTSLVLEDRWYCCYRANSQSIRNITCYFNANFQGVL